MQAFQTHTATQPISIQPLQTQQKPRVTEVRHNAEKHSLLVVYNVQSHCFPLDTFLIPFRDLTFYFQWFYIAFIYKYGVWVCNISVKVILLMVGSTQKV